MAIIPTDEKKPSLWNQALKAVKGDNTTDLVEQFTSEMTLVAEGLCEDQARLRSAVDALIRQNDGTRDKQHQDYQDLLRRIEDGERQSDEIRRELKSVSRRLDDLSRPKAREKNLKGLFTGDVIGRATLLASIVCGAWVLVTVLKLFM